jgi:hypothetical protein
MPVSLQGSRQITIISGHRGGAVIAIVKTGSIIARFPANLSALKTPAAQDEPLLYTQAHITTIGTPTQVTSGRAREAFRKINRRKAFWVANVIIGFSCPLFRYPGKCEKLETFTPLTT